MLKNHRHFSLSGIFFFFFSHFHPPPLTLSRLLIFCSAESFIRLTDWIFPWPCSRCMGDIRQSQDFVPRRPQTARSIRNSVLWNWQVSEMISRANELLPPDRVKSQQNFPNCKIPLPLITNSTRIRRIIRLGHFSHYIYGCIFISGFKFGCVCVCTVYLHTHTHSRSGYTGNAYFCDAAPTV